MSSSKDEPFQAMPSSRTSADRNGRQDPDLSEPTAVLSSPPATQTHHLYCCCRHATLCRKCGKAMKDRDETKAVVAALQVADRPPVANVHGNGPLLVSNIPASCQPMEDGGDKNRSVTTPHVVLGIDEAGRGSVLGPMVYGAAYWSTSAEAKVPRGFRDSKTLKEEDRFRLFDELLRHEDIGFAVRSILPSEISRNMLRTEAYNLNEMSHDAAIILIRKIVDGGVHVRTAYIDTVGNPDHYKRKLQREFPGIDFVVESKADAKYSPCSAASVVAKVMRDRLLQHWKFSESLDVSRDFGSGYPSDPKCKAWMEEPHDPVFGYNDFLRFSWAPTKQRLEDKAIPVLFRADLDNQEEDDLLQKKGMADFLAGKKRKRMGYFEKRNIQVVASLAWS